MDSDSLKVGITTDKTTPSGEVGRSDDETRWAVRASPTGSFNCYLIRIWPSVFRQHLVSKFRVVNVKRKLTLARLTLCSDDYGLNTGINDAILTLVSAGRLNAVSCMVVSPAFDANPLIKAVSCAPLPVQIGLHLTMTEYIPLAAMPCLTRDGCFPSVGSLLAKSHLRRINRAEIRLELERQFNAFERAFSRPPDFVDGHQHIHIFPGIREDVIALIAARMGHYEPNPCWVRCCDAPTADLIAMRDPRAVLLATMSRQQRPHRLRAGLRSNERFYGVNTFDRRQSFRRLMQGWLGLVAKRPSSALIMCHPGLGIPSAGDTIAARRADEFSYLQGAQFTEDLVTFGLALDECPQSSQA